MTNALCQKLNNVSVGKRKLKEAESVLSTMPVDEFEEKLDHKVTRDVKAECLDEYAQSMVRTLRLPTEEDWKKVLEELKQPKFLRETGGQDKKMLDVP